MAKLSLRLRLVALALSIAVLAAVIIGAAAATGQQVASLRKQIGSAQSESFRMADKLQAGVLSLNATLLRFVLGRNPAEWQKFEATCQALRTWVGEQRASTSQELQVLDEIRNQLTAYQEEARAIAAGNSAGQHDALAVLTGIENASQKILSLGYDLASAHHAATAQMVGESQKSLTFLQLVISVALALLLAVGVWVVTIFYREMIAPLRLKLVESRMVTERREKLASLGVLAAGVAHEIRNPLTAIKARLFMLKKAIQSTPGAVADAGVIEREINRLEHIVRDVLSFGRPAEPKYESLQATAFLRELHDLMSDQLSKANIQLIVEESADPVIHADPDQLKQVLLNLLQNAADSIEASGKIILRAGIGRANLRGRLSTVAILEVSDTGKGIPLEVQKRLFDPFYSTKPTGTGLGLSIAALIIERHGGALRYKTEVGRGTTFGILLPVAREPPKSMNEASLHR
ncbi:MAG TPA: ATP-binding protein [Chthoniobacterales bacterium]|nr:ATP-binding protein [Chthoniobacterales bacterium]